MRKQSFDSLQFLDGLRGLAAAYVMIGHARWLLWAGYSNAATLPHAYTGLNKFLLYSLSVFKFGHEAVLFFFVLSGFVIHLRYSRVLADNPEKAAFDWKAYTSRRARRIYPPLLFAMALTYLFDTTGMLNGYPIYFGHTSYPLLNANISTHHSILTALGNLFFLMTTYVQPWGTNGPLWSLKFEWWFYMVYPFLWLTAKKSRVMPTILMLLTFGLSYPRNFWPIKIASDIFSLLPSWWLGALLADVYTKRLPFSLQKIAPFCSLAIVLPFIHLDSTIQDNLWGVAFAGILAGFFAFQNSGHRLRLLEKLKPLGDMSYTLYVIHFPILVLFSGWLMTQTPAHELPHHFGWVIAGILICLGLAYIAHFGVEKPFRSRPGLGTPQPAASQRNQSRYIPQA